MFNPSAVLFETITAGFVLGIAKFFGKLALRIGGAFVVVRYVIEPMYNYLMGAMAQATAGDLGAWLELARVPDCFSVIMAAYGVRSAQSFMFKRIVGS
jgi:hypothetical protein